jgi:hypothetical protein
MLLDYFTPVILHATHVQRCVVFLFGRDTAAMAGKKQ